jgi:hypothetical protein
VGGDVTRPIATNDHSNIYHFKKQTVEKLISQTRILTICIGFHCDMKPTYKAVVRWLVRTTLSTVLYEIDVCMKF